MSETDTETNKIFIGPSTEPWWKFKLAGVLWSILGGHKSWATENIPYAKRIVLWCFRIRVLSRDFETIDDR